MILALSRKYRDAQPGGDKLVHRYAPVMIEVDLLEAACAAASIFLAWPVESRVAVTFAPSSFVACPGGNLNWRSARAYARPVRLRDHRRRNCRLRPGESPVGAHRCECAAARSRGA